VWPEASIGRGAQVKASVIGEGACVADGAELEGEVIVD